MEDIKAQNGKVIVGAMYITDDGKTRIYITLHEGRTSPMLGVGVNGTVTVDWGDGTEPDVLTGTSTSTLVYTPKHEYSKIGDYVISLSVEGQIKIFGTSSTHVYSRILTFSTSGDKRNVAYQTSVKRVELGNDVVIGDYAFGLCYSLESISIPIGVTGIGIGAFTSCACLQFVSIPNGATTIGTDAFKSCYSLTTISLPCSITTINNTAFRADYGCKYIVIPSSVTSIDSQAFQGCYSIVYMPIHSSKATIQHNAFYMLYGVRYFDFSSCTSVPKLSSSSGFSDCSDDFQILVPSALYDEWSTATNWATYASYMVAV